MPSVQLSPSVLCRLKTSKVFEDVTFEKDLNISTPFQRLTPSGPTISALEYDESGSILMASSECSDSLIVMDGMKTPSIKSVHKFSRTGIGIFRVGHHPSVVYHSTIRIEDSIKYLSVAENKYILTFSGHKRKIVSLECSPLDDMIISGAVDDSVMLWDPRTSGSPVASISMITGTPLVAFDPQGIVFAVALSHNRSLRLYDARAYERGPFSTWEIPSNSSTPTCSSWTRLNFSNDGNNILISGGHFSISAWDGSFRAMYQLPNPVVPKSISSLMVKISPDSQFVYGPAGDNKVAFWESFTGKGVSLLDTTHQKPISAVAFNPKYASMATACSSIVNIIS